VITQIVLVPLLTAAVGGMTDEPAAVSSGEVIDSIILRGNEKTKDFVILRELLYEPGDAVSEEDLREGANRLLNTGLFADVDCRLLHQEDPGALAVELEVMERPSWYVLPTLDWDPDLGENDWTRGVSFGISGRESNFRGEAQMLEGDVMLGAKESGTLAWTTPWLGEARTSLSLSASWEERRDPFYSKDQTVGRTDLGMTRRLTRHHEIGLGAAFEDIYRRPRENSQEGEEDALFATSSIHFGYDSRDLHISPRSGSLLRLSVARSRDWETGDYHFTSYSVDLRHFRNPVQEQTIALGLAATVTRGLMPEYKEVRVGGVNTVRGYAQGISHGLHSLVGTIEYRVPLVSKRSYDLPRIGHCDLSAATALFVDAGMTWSDSPFEEHLLFGVGVGSRLFVPFTDVIRLDYAWNRDLEGRWQFETNVKL
jgi:outer membrane protein insertion porin family